MGIHVLVCVDVPLNNHSINHVLVGYVLRISQYSFIMKTTHLNTAANRQFHKI